MRFSHVIIVFLEESYVNDDFFIIIIIIIIIKVTKQFVRFDLVVYALKGRNS